MKPPNWRQRHSFIGQITCAHNMSIRRLYRSVALASALMKSIIYPSSTTYKNDALAGVAVVIRILRELGQSKSSASLIRKNSPCKVQ